LEFLPGTAIALPAEHRLPLLAAEEGLAAETAEDSSSAGAGPVALDMGDCGDRQLQDKSERRAERMAGTIAVVAATAGKEVLRQSVGLEA
jgi:hypothetical protein